MESNARPSRSRRPARQPRRPNSYTPFGQAEIPADLSGRGLVAAHLAWLMANMDYFAGQGRATLHTVNRGLREDMELLRLTTPSNPHDQRPLIEKLQARLAYYEERIGIAHAILPDMLMVNLDDKKFCERRAQGLLALREAFAEYQRAREEWVAAKLAAQKK